MAIMKQGQQNNPYSSEGFHTNKVIADEQSEYKKNWL